MRTLDGGNAHSLPLSRFTLGALDFTNRRVVSYSGLAPRVAVREFTSTAPSPVPTTESVDFQANNVLLVTDYNIGSGRTWGVQRIGQNSQIRALIYWTEFQLPKVS